MLVQGDNMQKEERLDPELNLVNQTSGASEEKTNDL
jgi:hypothetical protein